LSSPWVIYGFVFVAAVLAAQALYWLVIGAQRQREAINRRLASSGDPEASRAPLDVLRQERGLASLDDERFGRLNGFLIQTGLRISKPKLVPWSLLLSLVTAVSLWLFASSPSLSAAAGLLFGPLFVALYLAIVRRRRINRFTALLPDALNIIVRSLRIGHPLPSAIALASREMPEPIAGEFGLTAEEISFGKDITAAVDNLHRRVGQDDLIFFVTAVSVQSQTGGNLADVLARLATLMRQRATLELKVKALSAEGRMSGWFLSAMPFVLYGAIRLLSNDYFAELTGSPALVPALVYGSVSLIVSNLIIYRMVRFRI
jgi:tight adherence protein B